MTLTKDGKDKGAKFPIDIKIGFKNLRIINVKVFLYLVDAPYQSVS